MSIYVKDADGNRTKVAGIGLPGPAGKSAYQYAVEGGFSGTEDEFRALMGVRSNPNLLHNWYFADPINQKGQTEYTAVGYTIDRWRLTSDSMSVSITEQGLHLEIVKSNPWWMLVQAIESTIFDSIKGKTVTLSILTNIGLDAYTCVIPDGNFDFDFDAIPGTSFRINLFRSAGSNPLFRIYTSPNIEIGRTLDVIAVKLELGPVQTLAHKEGDAWVLNDPPPDKALELLKCQRYMFVIRNTSGVNPGVGWGVANDSSTMSIDIPVPISMRAVPSVEMSGSWFLLGLGLSFEAESHTIYTRGYSQNTVSTAIAGFSGLEVGKAVSLIANNDPSAKIILDANL